MVIPGTKLRILCKLMPHYKIKVKAWVFTEDPPMQSELVYIDVKVEAANTSHAKLLTEMALDFKRDGFDGTIIEIKRSRFWWIDWFLMAPA